MTLPLTLPGILSGTVVIFAWTMSAFSTPQLVGGGKVLMISNLVYLQGLSSFNFPFAAVLSLLALAVAMGALGLMRPAVARLERGRRSIEPEARGEAALGLFWTASRRS